MSQGRATSEARKTRGNTLELCASGPRGRGSWGLAFVSWQGGGTEAGETWRLGDTDSTFSQSSQGSVPHLHTILPTNTAHKTPSKTPITMPDQRSGGASQQQQVIQRPQTWAEVIHDSRKAAAIAEARRDYRSRRRGYAPELRATASMPALLAVVGALSGLAAWRREGGRLSARALLDAAPLRAVRAMLEGGARPRGPTAVRGQVKARPVAAGGGAAPAPAPQQRQQPQQEVSAAGRLWGRTGRRSLCRRQGAGQAKPHATPRAKGPAGGCACPRRRPHAPPPSGSPPAPTTSPLLSSPRSPAARSPRGGRARSRRRSESGDTRACSLLLPPVRTQRQRPAVQRQSSGPNQQYPAAVRRPSTHHALGRARDRTILPSQNLPVQLIPPFLLHPLANPIL
jgi:hypothetical protein